jgi:hypothetical protein
MNRFHEFVVLLLTSGVALTQSPPSEVALPEAFLCRVEVRYPATANPDESRLESASVYHRNGLHREVHRWSDGSEVEFYVKQGMVLVRERGTTLIFTSEDPLRSLVAERGLLGFDWLGKATFAGQEKVEGKAVLAFRQRATSKVVPGSLAFFSDDGDTTPEVREAFLNPESGRPIALKTPEVEFHYQFADLPASEPALAGEFADSWRRYQETLRSLTSNRPAR